MQVVSAPCAASNPSESRLLLWAALLTSYSVGVSTETTCIVASTLPVRFYSPSLALGCAYNRRETSSA